jgi:hypothetical protein
MKFQQHSRYGPENTRIYFRISTLVSLRDFVVTAYLLGMFLDILRLPWFGHCLGKAKLREETELTKKSRTTI